MAGTLPGPGRPQPAQRQGRGRMTEPGHQPSLRVSRLARTAAGFAEGQRAVPAEVAVALSYNGSTHAVMMATPADYEDFAVGFSLSEGVIDGLSDIREIDVVETEAGIDLQIWLEIGRASCRERVCQYV